MKLIFDFLFFFWNQRIDSCNNQWKKIWENSNLYVERLKGSEIVLNGLEVMNKFVSCLETQLISKNMQYDPEALRKVHDDLIDIQSNIQIQQDAVDQLAEEAVVVRQLVIRSRNSVNIPNRFSIGIRPANIPLRKANRPAPSFSIATTTVPLSICMPNLVTPLVMCITACGNENTN